IIITRQGSLEGAVQAMRLGAQDYVTRPDDAETMRNAVDRSLTSIRAERRAVSDEMLTGRQAERQIHDMCVLSAVGRRILSILDWEEILPRIVDGAVYLTTASGGSLALVNEATGELRTVAAKADSEERAHYLQARPEKNASALQALSSGQPVLVYSHTEPSQSYLHVPVKVKDIVIGVISTFQKAENRPFDGHDVSLLNGLADYVVIAIHNSRNYQAMEEQARQQVRPPSPPHPAPAPEADEISLSELLQTLQDQGQEVRKGLGSATQLAQDLRQQVAIVESLTARLDHQGRAIESLASHLLPSELTRAEEKALETPSVVVDPESKVPLHHILECLRDGLLVSDANDKVLLANRAAARILRLPEERLVDQPLFTVCTDPRWSKTYLILKAATRLGPEEPGSEIKVVETPLTINEHMVQAVFVPLPRRRDEWQGAVTILCDRSGEHDTRRSRDEFITAISRDLQTPMTAIMGYADLLLEQSVGPLNETQNHFLQRVKANTKRMVNMLRDLIGVAAIDSGELGISPEPTEIPPLLEEVLTEIQAQLADKDLTVERSIPEHLPLALADPSGIQHVLTHLLANAYKCSVVGGHIGVTLNVRTAEELGSHAGGLERAMVMEITDSGGGIALEDQEKVFVRHYGEIPVVPGLGETGVGLSISKGLIEAHGGQIWLESQMGLGTMFIFTLPLAETASESQEQA
ncbi:MAG: ATP-binding protein, partial [Chloroflexota bacterium]|nr:ATP-binding protein [Chloroflexota bacterium]